MHTITLTDDQLRLVRSALHVYLESFSHDQPDILRGTKEVLALLPAEGGARTEVPAHAVH